jgi:DNA-directed RNA polymerase subunit RPC12/RpoP
MVSNPRIRNCHTVAVTCIKCGDIVTTNYTGRYYCEKCMHRIERGCHTVAVTCIVCGNLITTNYTGRHYCEECGYRKDHRIPQYIKKAIKNHPSFVNKDKKLKIYTEIMKVRYHELENKHWEQLMEQKNESA